MLMFRSGVRLEILRPQCEAAAGDDAVADVQPLVHDVAAFRFGAEAQRDTVAQFNDHDGVNLSFDGRASSLGRGQNVFGYAMADFIMGRLSGFNASGILDYNLSSWAYFFPIGSG